MVKKRKPGGGRKPSKPDYNPSAILQNQIEQAVALYRTEEHPSLQTICAEIDGNIPHNRESESNCTRLEGKVALSKN